MIHIRVPWLAEFDKKYSSIAWYGQTRKVICGRNVGRHLVKDDILWNGFPVDCEDCLKGIDTQSIRLAAQQAEYKRKGKRKWPESV